MYPWISRTLDFWLQFCEKKCGLYMDVYGMYHVMLSLVTTSFLLEFKSRALLCLLITIKKTQPNYFHSHSGAESYLLS